VTKSGTNKLKIRDKWMVNLSTTAIPTEVQYLLQHGENFSLPFFNKEKIVIELMKNIEGNSKKLDVDTQTNFRNRAIHIMNNVSAFLPPDNTVNNRLNKLNKTCNLFVKNNPNIIYTRADKGNTTVVLERNEYITKIKNMLQDDNTYTVINKDPTKNLLMN